MKKIYLIITTILIFNLANSQEACWIDFDSGYWVNQFYIDTIDTNNIWQIGVPNKPEFVSSSGIGIVTDTINSYPPNDTSVFYFTHYIWAWTSQALIGMWFNYQFDSDTINDYGMIEASFDGGASWINLVDDAVSSGFYWANSPPVLTGSTTDWQYAEILLSDGVYNFSWVDSIVYKFTFISDSIDNNRSGWLIDNFDFEDWWEGIDDKTYNNKTSIYPNPTTGKITIENSEYSIQNIGFFDIYGREVMKSENVTLRDSKCELDLSQQPKGIYFVKLNTEEGVRVEKVIKN